MSRLSRVSETNNADQSTNNFLALKRLKQTEEQIDMMKKRFMVLKAKDEQNRSKAFYNEQRIKTFEEIQKQKEQNKQALRKKQLRKQLQTEQMKEKNAKIKQQNRQKIKQTIQLIKSDKKSENKIMRQKRIENEKKFEDIKKTDISEKKKVRDKVISQERKQREKLNLYKNEKHRSNMQYKSIDANNLTSQRHNRQKELENLMKLELEMVKRNSESIMVSEKIKSRLKQVTGHFSKKKMHLPEINSHKNSSRGSNSTHI